MSICKLKFKVHQAQKQAHFAIIRSTPFDAALLFSARMLDRSSITFLNTISASNGDAMLIWFRLSLRATFLGDSFVGRGYCI